MSGTLNSSDPSVPSLDNTYGALLLGTFFGLILYGVNVHQLYQYIRLYPTDTFFIRLLVVFTMLLETAHTVLSMNTCYYYLVQQYFHPEAVSRLVWSIQLMPLIAGLIMIVAQIFFTRRLYLVGFGFRVVVWVATIFLVATFGFAVATSSESFHSQSLQQFTTYSWISSACFGSAMVTDTLLTGGLIIVLRRCRTGCKNTDSIIDTLIIYAINTGLVTGVFNILSFLLAAVLPNNLIYGLFNIVTARLYANTFLAVLNSRKLMLSHGIEVFDKAPVGVDIFARANRLTTAERWNAPQLPEHVAQGPALISIKVTTQAESDKHHGMESGHNDAESEDGDMKIQLKPLRRGA